MRLLDLYKKGYIKFITKLNLPENVKSFLLLNNSHYIPIIIVFLIIISLNPSPNSSNSSKYEDTESTKIVTKTNEEKVLSLVEASINGDFIMAKKAIEKDADVNKPDEKGWYAIIEASGSDSLKLVKLLIEKGADVNQEQKDNGMRPLYSASMNGKLKNFKHLLDSGADLSRSALKNGHDNNDIVYATVYSGNIEFVKYLEEIGYDIDIKAESGDSWSAIHAAAESGNIEMVQFFIERGHDVKTANNSEVTLLHTAILNGHLNLVKYLVEQHHLDVNAEYYGGEVLHDIAKYPEIETYLDNNGLDRPVTYAFITKNNKIWPELAIGIADLYDISASKVINIWAIESNYSNLVYGTRWDGVTTIEIDGIEMKTKFSAFVK